MTAAVARYQGNWAELIFAKTSGNVKCGLWTILWTGEKSIPEVFSNLTRPGFFQCFKRSKWSDGSRPSSEIIQMIHAFLPCRGDSTFFIIQRFLFNKSSTFFLPFFNCKHKEKRSLLVKLMKAFEATHTGMFLCDNYISLYKKMYTKSQRNVAPLFQHNAWFVFLTIMPKVIAAKCGHLYPLSAKFLFLLVQLNPALRIPA